MTPLEKKLLEETCGGREPRLLMRTRTRIDAGRWWRTNPLWLCIDGSDLVLFAVGRRKYLERVPIADCQKSHYSHASGDLMIAPCETLLYDRCALSPREALNVLDFLKNDPKTNHQNLNTETKIC